MLEYGMIFSSFNQNIALVFKNVVIFIKQRAHDNIFNVLIIWKHTNISNAKIGIKRGNSYQENEEISRWKA